jgi:hypothetical protein
MHIYAAYCLAPSVTKYAALPLTSSVNILPRLISILKANRGSSFYALFRHRSYDPSQSHETVSLMPEAEPSGIRPARYWNEINKARIGPVP